MDGLRIGIKNHTIKKQTNNLRLPNINRSNEFKVSLRGWLYRLEGAAIKQWKRRWCVLADYCLFYYKDVNEEKMLGSLLLPSYKISPCFNNIDGITRKYSFKAEHQNMKTYYFAADTKELQQQWMNILSMASIMQLNIIFSQSQSKINNLNDINKSNGQEQDESGFIEYQKIKKCLEINDNNQIYNNNNENYQTASATTTSSIYNYNSIGLPLYYYQNYQNNQHLQQHHQQQQQQQPPPPKPQRYYDLQYYQQQQRQFYPYQPYTNNFITQQQNYYNEQQQQPYHFDYNNAIISQQPFDQYFLTNYDYQQQQIQQQQIQQPVNRQPVQRPHSAADFLDRNQFLSNDAEDVECQQLFQSNNNKTGDIITNLLITNDAQEKIMPTRPKSNIEKYNDQDDLFNDNTNYYQQQQNLQATVTQLPNRPPLPQEYLLMKYQQKKLIGLPIDNFNGNNGKLLNYSSDDEHTNNNNNNNNNNNSIIPNKPISNNDNDELELSREEYQRASKLFFKKQINYLQLNNNLTMKSNCNLNDKKQVIIDYNNDDWNEIGLPLLSNTIICNQKINEINDNNDDDDDDEMKIKFKLGLNVRTYRKPKSNNDNNNIDNCNNENNKHNAAPYYYSDLLLNEEQKNLLQKKLGNFTEPPKLLSRCNNQTKHRLSKKQILNDENKSTEDVKDLKQELNNNETIKNSDKTSDIVVDPLNHQHQQQIYENCIQNSNKKLTTTTTTTTNRKTMKKLTLTPQLNNDDSLDSLNELSPNETITLTNRIKKRRKRKSKENLNNSNANASDSEIQLNDDDCGKYKNYFTLNNNNNNNNKRIMRKNLFLKLSRKFSVSATEFMDKSHEELILILIKLHRKQSQLSKQCEQIRLQMDSEIKMMELEPYRKDDYQQRYQELSKRWQMLNNELQLQIPIIQTIDHMIKIKSKTKLNELNKKKAASTSLLDCCIDNNDNNDDDNDDNNDNDKNDKNADVVDNTNPNNNNNNNNIETLKQQQKLLESELDRVRGMLTHSTKKLEEKAVENARMEQEMLLAKNKLKQLLDNEQELSMELTRSSKIEAELLHINQVIDNLHLRRIELNNAIENLKCNSDLSTINDDDDDDDKNVDEFVIMNNETDLYPLYENIKKQQQLELDDDDDDDLNDEFFTLNINLDKPKDNSRNENKDNKQQHNNNNNLSTMCEFDPNKIMTTYGHGGGGGDSIVDQQLKQIYNYQQLQFNNKLNNEVKTVREVKRESERRKFNQQRSAAVQKMNYFNSNHYFNDNNDDDDDDTETDTDTDTDTDNDNDVNDEINHKTIDQQQFIKFDTNDDTINNNFNNVTPPDIVQSTIKLIDK